MPGGQCQIIIFLSNTELDEKQVFDNNRSVLPPPSPITPVKWQFCGWADNNDDDTQIILIIILIKPKEEEDDDYEDEMFLMVKMTNEMIKMTIMMMMTMMGKWMRWVG